MYKIKEAGRNGTVEIKGTRLVRTIKKRIGRNDEQVIPISSVSHVEIDRKLLGADTVLVHVGTRTYAWKTSRAEELADRVIALHDGRVPPSGPHQLAV